MENLGFKYFIIFSLLQYSTAMVLNSLNYHKSRYLKEQSKVTFYTHNPYIARRDLDYNYKDWEEKKTDIYDYLLSSTNQTSTTASDIFTEATTQKMVHKDIPENLTLGISEFSKWLSSLSSSTTYSTIPSTESIPDTSLATTYTVSTPLSIIPSFSTPPTTTTTLTSELTTDSTTTEFTTLSTITTTYRVGQFIRDELLEAKANLRGGFFTASIYILLKIIERKDGSDVISLLNGLQGEISRLNSNHHLAMFGPTVNSVFTFMVLNMATVPVVLIQSQAKYGIELIEHRKTALEIDTKAIFDVVDTIYTQEEFMHITEMLINIQNFPNVSKNALDLAKEVMEAFILIPYRRIQGTAKEKLLLMQIHSVVEKRMAVDENKTLRPRFEYRKNFKRPTKMIAANITKFIDTKFTNRQLRMNIVWPTSYKDPTTINSSEIDYTSYVKDIKMMTGLKRKTRPYKKKNKRIRFQERKEKSKKGPASTTSIITTINTEMFPMHESKYFMRKNTQKNLYKIKINTEKTTKFLWRFYGKVKTIRRFTDVDNFEATKYSFPNDSNVSDNYYSDSDKEDYVTDAYKSNYFTRPMTPSKFKSVNQFNSNKNNNNVLDEESNMNIQDINKTQGFESKSTSSDSYCSDSDEKDYESDARNSSDVFRPVTPAKLKSVSQFRTYKKDITNHILHSKNIIENSKSMYENQYINKKHRSINKPKNSDSDAEAYLQVHLKDALFHRNNITIDRRYIKKKVNKLRSLDSFSDDEAILKSNIYKVFGYSNNFAKQLKALL